MTNQKRLSGLKTAMLFRALFPLIVLGIVIMIVCSNLFSKAIYSEVEAGLRNMLLTVFHVYEAANQDGSVTYQDNKMMMAPEVMQENLKQIDDMKADTGVDITIFNKETRVATTVEGENKERLTNTQAHPLIVKDVLEQKEEHFYESVVINGIDYFAYYMPLYDNAGACIGMLGAAKPSEAVKQSVMRSVRPILLFIVIGVVLAAWISLSFMRDIVGVIVHMTEFMKRLSKGQLSAELEQSILVREDELGELGRYSIHMQREVRRLIEKDTLTGIDNRISAEKRWQSIHRENALSGNSYIVVLIDVDDFRKINAQYGKEGGDLVLKNVARILNDNISGKGFAARWNGAEFLVILDLQSKEEAIQLLEQILHKIRKEKISLGDCILNVSITLGAAEGAGDKEINQILKEASDKLFRGKELGRNQLVI